MASLNEKYKFLINSIGAAAGEVLEKTEIEPEKRINPVKNDLKELRSILKRIVQVNNLYQTRLNNLDKDADHLEDSKSATSE